MKKDFLSQQHSFVVAEIFVQTAFAVLLCFGKMTAAVKTHYFFEEQLVASFKLAVSFSDFR